MSDQRMIPAKVEKREPKMNEYRFTVVVKTDTVEHADQVMGERLGFDEEYEDEGGVKFDYTVDYSIADTALASDEPNPVGDAPDDFLFFAKQQHKPLSVGDRVRIPIYKGMPSHVRRDGSRVGYYSAVVEKIGRKNATVRYHSKIDAKHHDITECKMPVASDRANCAYAKRRDVPFAEVVR